MRRRFSPVLLGLLILTGATPDRAQDGPLRVEPLAEGSPTELSAPIRGALMDKGLRVLDSKNQPYAELWLRKAVPASATPGGPKGAVLFPVLGEGELIGAMKLIQEGHDYRDQAITPGVYTLRYGLQPVNGDHLGVSTYRDYALMLPAGKDTALDALGRKPLETRSAEAAGTNHPAVLMLIAPPAGASTPGVVQDAEKNLHGLILALPLNVAGESAASPLPVQLILVGAAPV